jgi:alginate O-acetyltransferase complex protein AlgI
MLFSSIAFLFYFLPLFFLFYGLSPWKNVALLTASLVFYAWGEPVYVLLLLASIVLNFGCGLLIAREQRMGGCGRRSLALGVAVNLLVLAYFKYFAFLVGSLAIVVEAFGFTPPQPEPVVLPLGISFYTFHALSYLIDVYRGHTPVERNVLALGTYITMFPQLVAGPIIRFKTISKELHRRRHTLNRTRLGVELFVIGLAQKVLLANTLAIPADQIFALPTSDLTLATSWLGVVCYTLQIYFDFAGYSNMAIGLGLMIGFAFPRNFNYPYISQSVTEFWRRWHISLSTWFRDYLYIPLGGNRGQPWRTFLNLMIVFLLCGLWHGASWTFVLWGFYYGVFLILERVGLLTVLARLPAAIRHAYLLLVVMIGWVFFRCDTLGQAMAMLSAMASSGQGDPVLHPIAAYLSATTLTALIVGAVASTRAGREVGVVVGNWDRAGGVAGRGLRAAYAGYTAGLLLLCAANLASGTYNPFIYFRF